jgi:transposase
VRARQAPRRGRPYGHGKTSTFVAALRCGGIEAPCVFDGPINSARFLAYAEQCLVPALRPGDIVSLDNLGSHKSKSSTRRHSGRRSQAHLPPGLFARSEPDRSFGGLRRSSPS